MDYKLLFPGFKTKSVTLSFDDGTFYDVWLTEFINKLGLKCTYNINSALFGAIAELNFPEKVVFHNRISAQQTRMLYAGHELAAHSLHHPLLTNRTKEFLDEEVLKDLENLQKLSDAPVEGFVIPGGPHGEFLDSYLRKRVLYTRTGDSCLSYRIPESFNPFDPSVYILHDDFEKFSCDYLSYDADEISWLYIWGHSYEFALDGAFERFERVCKKLAGRDDIYYATNGDIIRYVTDGRRVRVDGDMLINDSGREIYISLDGRNIVLSPESKIKTDVK